jgi:ERCC4-type nuclease
MTIAAVMIDSREPKWVQELTFGGIPSIVEYLEAGDILATTESGEMILIERKTPDDFLNSLADDRMFLQVSHMRLITPWSYVLITGEFRRSPEGKVLTSRPTNWNWDSIQGALLSIQELGVFVSFCGNDTEYERGVLRIGSRDHRDVMDIPPAKTPHIFNISESIIASLPGIGIERMRTVMDFCNGEPGWAICGLADPNVVFPGIPKSVNKRVREALKLKDNESINILVNEEEKEI